MAELATIARPYAEALFQSAGDQHAATLGWLDALAAVAAEPQLLQFAGNPGVRDEQVFDVVSGVADSSGLALPGNAQNFLRAVIANGRLAALPAIAVQFRALANAWSGTSDAVVYSAFPLDAAALDGLSDVLEKRFGRKLQLSVAQDASLIGGVRVVVGDEVLDLSVRARLDQMKTALSA